VADNQLNQHSSRNYRSSVQLYERLPFFISLYVIVEFLAAWILISNCVAASLIAGIPAAFGLSRWAIAARGKWGQPESLSE
jgi:ABC-type polysaccharide transport system permease subunit